jgi:hypothetical protein
MICSVTPPPRALLFGRTSGMHPSQQGGRSVLTNPGNYQVKLLFTRSFIAEWEASTELEQSARR